MSLSKFESKELPEHIERLRLNYQVQLIDQCASTFRDKLSLLPVAALNFLFQYAYFTISQGIPSKIVGIDFDTNLAATFIDDEGVLRIPKRFND